MQKDLLLVRLPKIPSVNHDFYGIGYYTDHGFVFMLITEELINARPLRSFPFPENTGYDSANQFEIIGQIKNPENVQVNRKIPNCSCGEKAAYHLLNNKDCWRCSKCVNEEK